MSKSNRNVRTELKKSTATKTNETNEFIMGMTHAIRKPNSKYTLLKFNPKVLDY